LHLLEDRLVPSALTITTARLPNWDATLPGYSQVIATTGGATTPTFSLSSGALPAGLQLSSSGTISGTPTTPGAASFQIAASDGLTTVTQNFAVGIAAPLALGPSSIAAATFGAPYHQQLTATGGTGAVRFSIQGSGVPGITLNSLNGLLGGSPTAGGSFSLTVAVTDSVKAITTQSYTMTVHLAVAATVTPGWDVSQAGYSQTIKVRGGVAPLIYSVTAGALPTGMTLNTSSGALGGIPQAVGPSSFTIAVTDARGTTGSQAYAIQINPTPAILTTSLPSWDVGKAYRQSIAWSGGTGPYLFRVKGSLPAGLTLGGRTGIISGTPSTSGNYAFTIILTDASGATASQAYAVTMSPPLTIRTLSLPQARLNSSYSQTIAFRGGTGPVAFKLTGNLPAGLQLDPATGVLSGSPTLAGTFAFAVTITDQAGASPTKKFAIAVPLITDPNTAYAVPVVSRPGYLQTIIDPTFGTQVTRIAGDAGAAVTTSDGTVLGTWSSDARHNYNLNEAWNANSSLIVIENRGDDGGTPNQLYLNGTTYQVEFGTPSNMPGEGTYDQRWNPNPRYPNDVLLAGNDGSNTLYWFNVVTNTIDRTYTLPMPVSYIGNTKGNASQNGRYICMGDMTHFFVVDMAAYPVQRIGPVFDLGSLGINGDVDSYSISPSGNFVVVHWNSVNGQASDAEEVLRVNPLTLALAPQRMSTWWPGMLGNPALGFVYSLGHEDMALNPYLGNADVMVGQEECDNIGATIPGIKTVNRDGIGHVVMVELANGAVTSLTDPYSDTVPSEAFADHMSCRNILRPGWCYVAYYNEIGNRYSDALIAVKLDGSGSVEQLAHLHTDNDDTSLPQLSVDPDFDYRSEAHPVPSPDGMRVIFASNWLYQGTGGMWIEDYVVQLPSLQQSVFTAALPL
jgi:hypothetical protein